jgi:hypothetical protein
MWEMKLYNWIYKNKKLNKHKMKIIIKSLTIKKIEKLEIMKI